MDDDELKGRVSRALERRSLAAKRLKTFYFDMAEAADSSVGAVKNWLKGDNAPDAAALLNLFENVPGFEAEVRGTGNAPASEHEQAMAEIQKITARFATRTGAK